LLILVALWVIGGQGKRSLRLVGCPILLGIGLSTNSGSSWLLWASLATGTVFLSQFSIRIGYGGWEEGEKNCFLAELTKDHSGEYVRLIWGIIVGIATAIVVSVALKAWILFSLYVLLNAVVNYSVSKFKLRVFLTDILVSLSYGSWIFVR
jgi:hypothetical protein